MPTVETESVIGRAPEDLSLTERFALAGKWMALERYSLPHVAPVEGKPEVALVLRRIQAIGDSPEECARRLGAQGLDPAHFEFIRLKPPYGGLAS